MIGGPLLFALFPACGVGSIHEGKADVGKAYYAGPPRGRAPPQAS